jgi:sn-glycerol 3-phosphate transport system ATP-binding protein
MKEIIFKNICKSYGDNLVVDDFNLTVNEGERLVLLGPSGCGKSTILRIIAGLEKISSGQLFINNQCVNDVKSGDRNIAMVFQNYALFPHMSVTDNIVYGLKVHNIESKEIKRRLNKAIDMLELNGLEDRKPKDLSGGQRQRVALARAVVKRSDFFLLDEPLSNLDSQLRGHARKELVKIHDIYKQTFIYVTHDQVEAMTIGHRIALMNKGVLQMVDTPHNVYNRPANIFTAKFIGSPATNIIDAYFIDGKITIGSQNITLQKSWNDILSNNKENFVNLGIRPEHIKLSKKVTKNSLKGTIKYIEDYGNKLGIYIDLEDFEIIAISDGDIYEANSEIYLEFDDMKLHFFNFETKKSLGYPKEWN